MKKKIIVLSVVIVFVMLCLAGLLYLKNNRGGVKVSCSNEYEINRNLLAYRQDDKIWKEDHLGTSKYTIGSSGCVITCIASVISETDMKMNPKEFNAFLFDNDVYDGEGNLQWGKLEAIDGFHVKVYTEISSQIIDECLSNNRYPIVKVHQNNIFSYHHYILIIGSENGEYICMDPLKDDLTKLSDYGNKIYAIRCVWYE